MIIYSKYLISEWNPHRFSLTIRMAGSKLLDQLVVVVLQQDGAVLLSCYQEGDPLIMLLIVAT
jgi:hypothetical protein